MTIRTIPRQGDPPHGPMLLGHSKTTTVGRGGCLLCCLWMLGRLQTPDVTPDSVAGLNRFLRDVPGAFLRASGAMNVPVAARAIGLQLLDASGFDLDIVTQSIGCGWPVIVGIDYKPGRSSGLSDADHFVLAIGVDDGVVQFADPATGREVRMADGGTYGKGPATFCEQRLFSVSL